MLKRMGTENGESVVACCVRMCRRDLHFWKDGCYNTPPSDKGGGTNVASLVWKEAHQVRLMTSLRRLSQQKLAGRLGLLCQGR